jgi:ankyrin repeat protein
MPSRTLPSRPNLAQLKRQAEELRRAHREGKRSAAARVAAHHPHMKDQPPAAVLAHRLSVANAQYIIAHEYGFDSWPRLKHHVDTAARVAKYRAHPRFDEAVAAMDAGNTDRLRHLLAAEPALVHARTNLEPPFHYFTGATLLHHVAGNPDRGRLDGMLGLMPANTVEIARLLLDAGSDVHAVTLGRNGGSTMGLLLTSKQASDAGLSGPLMDVLVEYGATIDLQAPDALDDSLKNHAPRAAEKMIALGAKPDVLAAAALGRMDLLRAAFDEKGRLRVRPRRDGKLMAARDATGLALLYAYVRKQCDAIDFLLTMDGNWNMTGVNNGAALHRAAFDGDLQMVQRLIAKGADLYNRDNPFVSTPLSWAQHNKQDAVFTWLRTRCAIDIHDAAGFDLREHVEARLREDPACVNKRLDQWDIPGGTPLHWAACPEYNNIDGSFLDNLVTRRQLVKLLLEHGADPNIVAGNGYTALDIAEAYSATGIATLLKRHGAKRAAEL